MDTSIPTPDGDSDHGGSQASQEPRQQFTESGVELPAAQEDSLIKANILDLHPTQLVVGMQQVEEKAQRIAHKQLYRKAKKRDRWLRNHAIPVVWGPTPERSPEGALYLIDHHHLASALLTQGITECWVQVVMDWRDMDWMAFWQAMHAKGYVWTHSVGGDELDLNTFVSALPPDVRGLKDDKYRSLAALVRKAGGYEKVWVPFSEFRWANFLRSRVPVNEGVSPDDPQVLSVAMQQARAPDAAHLPGYNVDRPDPPAQ